MVLALFARTERNHAPSAVVMTLGLSDRMEQVLLGRWVEDGWVEVADQIPPGTGLCFIGKLSAIHRKFIGNGLAW